MTQDIKDMLIIAFIMLLFFVLYMMPSLIAFKRKSINRFIIFLFNIPTGITGLGWVLLIVWAMIDPEEKEFTLK